MRPRAVFLLAGLSVSGPAAASEWKLSLFGGRSVPSYEQTFAYDASALHAPIPFPGISIQERGSFALTAKGGLALGGALTFFATDVVGVEARFDVVDVKVEPTGVHFTATVTSAFPPLPSFAASLDLPPGQFDVDRLTPISLGLRLRTPGRVRLSAAAGVSYLPRIGATATQTLGVSLTPFVSPIEVARATVRAAPATTEAPGRWGGTAAVSLELPLGARTSLEVEARAFRFGAVTLRWQLVEPATGPLSELLDEGVARIDPVRFEPTFYQATAGIAIRF